jgi:hypothetical protein
MARFEVEIQRTVYTSVEVEAASPEAAREQVESVMFPLPPLSEWEALDGEEVIVRDERGEEVDALR